MGRREEELINLKQKQEHYYNRSAQVVPELQPSTKVYVQLQLQSRDWKPATVLQSMDYNKYKIQLDFNGKEYIRNQIYIKPKVSGERQSQRTITKPSRYKDSQGAIATMRGDVVTLDILELLTKGLQSNQM